MQLPLVYIIVLNWNGERFIVKCLEAIFHLDYPNYKVMIVDNDSTDSSVERIRKKYPEVQIIENGANVGFAQGNNIGIKYALENGTRYIALLNSDTEVEANWLNELVMVAMKDKQIGICGSKMLMYYNRTIINSTGIVLNLLGETWDRGMGRIDTPKWNIAGDVLGVSGGAFFVRREVIEKIGLFDPGFFLYYEDLDFCIRTWNSGYRVVFVPSAVVYHRFMGSIGTKLSFKHYCATQSRLRLLAKAFPLKVAIKAFPRIFVYELKRIKSFFISRRYSFILAEIKAIFSFLLGLRSALKLRFKGGNSIWSLRHMLQWDYGVPDNFNPVPDYAIANESSTGLNSRILIGIIENGLGDGWYHLERNPFYFRWMSKTATSFFMSDGEKKIICQIHVCMPYGFGNSQILTLYCNGTEIKKAPIKEGWETHQFFLGKLSGILKITMSLNNIIEKEKTGDCRDLGLMINEISILPSGSSLLKKGF